MRLYTLASFVTLGILTGLLAGSFCLRPALAQAPAGATPAQQLVKGSVTERVNAAKQLAGIGDAAAVDALIAAMQDDNPLVRVAVTTALGQIGDKRATPVLLAAMKDDFIVVSAQAIIALGKLQDPAAADALLPIAQDANNPKHQDALLALGEMADPRVFTSLLALHLAEKTAEKPDALLLQRIEAALANYPLEKIETPLLVALKDPRTPIRLTALQLIHDPLPAHLTDVLITLLNDPELDIRMCAGNRLAHCPDPRVTEGLLNLTHDDNVEMCLAAVNTLRGRKDPRALEPLISLLKTAPVGQVRCAAASALGQYRDARSTDALFALLHDDWTPIAAAGVMALKDNDDPRINDAVLPLLTNKSSELRNAAIIVLGSRGEKRAAPVIISALAQCIRKARTGNTAAQNEESQYTTIIQQSCIRALAQLGPVAADTLVAMLRTGGYDSQCWNAIEVLPFIPDPRVADSLLALLHDENADLRAMAVRVLSTPFSAHDNWYTTIRDLLYQHYSPCHCDCWTADRRVVDALCGLLNDPKEDVRINAVRALGLIGDTRAVPSLLAMATNSRSESLRWTIVDILGAIGDRRASGLLKKLALTDMRAISACASLPDSEALMGLVGMLQHTTDDRTHRLVIEALRQNRDPRTLRALLAILHNEKVAELREAVGWALCGRNDVRAVDALIAEQQDPVEWARSSAAEALITIDDRRAAPTFIAGLKDTNVRYRLRCAHWLMKQRDPRGVEAFLPTLDDTDTMTQYMANSALLDCHDPRIIPILINHLPGADVETVERFYYSDCAGLLIELGGQRGIDALAKLLPSVNAALALARIKDPRAIIPLRDLLKSASPSQQADAALALAKMGQGDGCDFLLAATKKSDNDLRYAALLALGEPLPGEPAAVKETLAAALSYPDALTRVLAARALLVRGDARAVPALVKAAQQNGDQMPYALARCTLCEITDPAMQQSLQQSPLLVALAAEVSSPEQSDLKRAESLVMLGAMRAAQTSALAEMMFVKSTSPVLRDAAVRALGKLSNTPHVLTLLLTALKDDDPYLRQHAAIGLGAIHNKAAITPLIDLLTHEQVTIVQRAVVAALKQLTGQDLGDDAAKWRAWQG